MRTLSIIGAGKAARTLARLWRDTGVFSPGSILNSSPASTVAAAAFIGGGEPVETLAGREQSDLYMIGVRDDDIANISRELEDFIKPGALVFHISGSQPSSVLANLRGRGAVIASLHPIQSFADPALSIKNFVGTACALEGDEQALEILKPAVETIGGVPMTIRADKKIIYHAASVFASNYMTVLIDTALRCLEEAGIERDKGLEALTPILRQTVENIAARGPQEALTGPIARGDAALVGAQLKALREWNEDTGALYAALGLATAEMAGADKSVKDTLKRR